MRTEVRPKTTLAVETELWCNDHLVQSEETSVTSEKIAGEWNSFGINIPRDLTGECHLERHIQSEDKDGSAFQDLELRRPINLMVER